MENLDVSIKRGPIHLRMDEALEEPVIHCTGPLIQRVEGSLLRLEATTRQSLDLDVAIPSTIRHINLNCESGTVQITGVRVETADAHVGNGAILADDISGHWDVNIGRGDLALNGGNGSFDLNAGLGSIHLHSLHNTTANVHAGLGPVLLEHSQGTFDINAGKGDVNLDTVRGQIKVHAGLGKIVLTNCEDVECELESGMGSISLRDGHYRRSQLETAIGQIDVHARAESLSATVETRGDINIEIPDDLSCRIEASTDLGRIVSHLDLVEVNNPGPARGHRLVGQIGNGTHGVIHLRTRKGNISLSQYPALPPNLVPSAPSSFHTEDPRGTILEKLQRGIITVEEAAQLLDGLESGSLDR